MNASEKRWEGVSEAVRTSMQGNKSKDTKPELLVRKLLRAAGYGYRLHRKDLPGKPDIAFIGRRKAIFKHGCFWHQHEGCRRASKPKSRLGRELIQPAAVARVFVLRLGFPAQEVRDGTVVLALR